MSNDPYTSPLFHSDTKRGFNCRIYTEVDNGNAGRRGRGGTRKRYGIIERSRNLYDKRIRVTFVKRGSWIAQTQGPCGDAIMECAGRTQLDALIRLAAWCADEWNRERIREECSREMPYDCASDHSGDVPAWMRGEQMELD
jgi:hypothetical protein